MPKKIVIASILKPVDDVRGYWKIAQLLAKTNKYEVNIIGNAGKKDVSHPNIDFSPHRIRRDRLLQRFLIRYRILFTSLKTRPSIFIFTTHELLLAAVILKLVSGCKIIYDVQENYRKNVLISKGPFSTIYSKIIALKEGLFVGYIDHLWLAEKCYKRELKLEDRNCFVIQNKALDIHIKREKSSSIRLLFSGTISDYSGIRSALRIIQQIIKNEKESEAIIVGQVHDSTLKSWLENEVLEYSQIQLITSYDPVPYDEIVQQIQWANMGIISYQPNEVNQNKVPTKLYEYSRYKLPYLIQQNTLWSKVGTRLGMGIAVDFKQPDYEKIIETWKKVLQNPSNTYQEADTWEFESRRVIDSIDELLH